jgi:hypothetical protein
VYFPRSLCLDAGQVYRGVIKKSSYNFKSRNFYCGFFYVSEFFPLNRKPKGSITKRNRYLPVTSPTMVTTAAATIRMILVFLLIWKRDLALGIRDLGFGIWDLGFGIWDLGLGIRH